MTPDPRRVTAKIALALGLAIACVGCSDPETHPALVLVTVDTLRADYLGAYGSDRGLTPELDALAERSVVFEQAYAAAPFTVPSVVALLTGRFPEELGILDNEVKLPEDVPTLASTLQASGWRTGAVVSNFVLRRASGLDRGFDHFDDQFTQREARRKWPERDAPGTTAAAVALLEKLARGGAPFFLWVHYQDPHGPYTPPDALRKAQLPRERAEPDGRKRLLPARDPRGLGTLPSYQQLGKQREVAFYRAGYAGEVAFMDAGVGELLAAFETLGLGERATLVFTADHGEGMGDQDYWFAHGEFLRDELTRVPLFVARPGAPPGRRTDLVAQADLYSSLLPLLGVFPEGAAPHARDLFAPEAEAGSSTAYLASLRGSTRPRRGLVRDGHKVVATRHDDGLTWELFALGAEDRDLSAEEPERLQALQQELLSLRAELRVGDAEAQEISESDRQALEALGYLEPQREDGPEPSER